MDEIDLALISFYATLFSDSSASNRVKDLRLSALKRLRTQLAYYQQRGFITKLILAIAEKKGELIMEATSQTDIEKIKGTMSVF